MENTKERQSCPYIYIYILLCTYETNILGGKLLLFIIRKSCIKTREMEINILVKLMMEHTVG